MKVKQHNRKGTTYKQTQPMTVEELLLQKLPHWRVHPADFILEALGIDSLTEQQRLAAEEWGAILATRLIKIARSRGVSDAALHPTLRPFLPRYDELHDKVGMSIMSCKGAGKDFLAALLVMHFMATNPGLNGLTTKVLVTAPSAHQLDDVFWAEFSKQLTRRNEKGEPRYLFAHQFEKTATRFFYKGARETWFTVGRTAASKASDQQSGTLAGLHADHLLVVYDEWSDIADPITNALQTTLTQPFNFALGLFNPKRRTGAAYRSHFDQAESQKWVRIHWSALDCPLVTQDQIKKYRQLGERNNLYRVNILGLPPLEESDVLIPWDWLMNAANFEGQPNPDDPVVIGVDPAGQGSDHYMVCIRRGNYVIDFVTLTPARMDEMALQLLKLIRQHNAEYIVIDNTGGYGWALYETVSQYHPYTYAPLMSEAPMDEQYANLRAELYWDLRSRFERGIIRIPNDDQVIDELSLVRVKDAPRKKLALRSKREIRKELGASPDRADALAISLYADRFINNMTAATRLRRYLDDDDDELDDVRVSWLGV